MSLNASLLIGKSAITASQAAMQVAGNNMANAATPGFSRQVTSLSPSAPERIGRNQFVGTGVQLQSIHRAVDTALQARLRSAISDEQGTLVDQRFLQSVETLQNELTDNDLSTLLGAFFNSFSELANNPLDSAVRNVVVQQGATLAARVQDMHDGYDTIRREIDSSLEASVAKANGLVDQIAELNVRIAQTEQGQSEAGSLRDQRDRLVEELSGLIDVSVIEQPGGAIDVLVGSLPVVLGSQSRGLELRTRTVGDALEVSVRVAADGSQLTVRSGSIGALLRQRTDTVAPALERLDDFAAQLILQVNNLHAQGQGLKGHQSISGTNSVPDTATALNATANDLPWPVRNGAFTIHVTHEGSGSRTSFVVPVDGNVDSLDDLVDRINNVVGVSQVTASIGLDNTLSLAADPGYSITFSDDSSGVLAALGVNGFFAGRGAGDIEVWAPLLDDPALVAAGLDHVPGSNENALAIVALQDVAVDALGGRTLGEHWQAGVNELAVRGDAAGNAAESARLVRESIAAQHQAVSGVSLDEEAVNLLAFQRQFQAAARFVAAIDEVMQTLLSIA